SLRVVDFRGDRGYVYRLEIAPGPRVVAAIPPVGRRGETRSVEFVGHGIATGQMKLESVTRQVTFPASAGDSFQYRLETPHGTAPAFRLFVSDREEKVAAPGMLTLPAAISGCLERAGAEDRYALKGKKGDLWTLALEAR